MYDLMIYSFKAGACLAVFYLFFKLLLSRETFHCVNRIVVLGAMVLSFVLPLCVITVVLELPGQFEMPVLPENGAFVVPDEPQPEPFDWAALAGGVFLAGAAAMLGWTLWSLCCVLRLVRRGRRERLDDGAVLVRLEQAVTPFSWGRYIVISERDLVESGAEIITHERAHLRLHHSWDLLLTDLAGCLQWFNPAMWLLRRELRAIHEYEADQAVLRSGVDAKHYQLMLIKKAAGGRWYSVANSFNHSKLKNRIAMMLQKKSSHWAVAKALFVVPLTALALGAFARTVYVVPEDKGKKESVSVQIQGSDVSISGVAGKPLYIVDGVEIPDQDLSGIAVSRISSMTVLKGGEAVSKYGERAKDGVVLVTLRKPGEPLVVPAANASESVDDVVVVSFGKNGMQELKAPEVRVEADDPTGKVGLTTGSRVIRIRGGKADTTKHSEPLLIVDGRIASGEEFKELQPDQIATMSVSKDPKDIKELEKAVNGIVTVTTKQSRDAMVAAQTYFNSDAWKQVRKKIAESDKYFDSKEWTQIEERLKGAMQHVSVNLPKEVGGAVVATSGGKVRYENATGAAIVAEKTETAAGADFSTGVGMARVTHKKTESGDTRSVVKGRVTADVTGMPDKTLILIDGTKATKADVAALAPKKIRRMDIFRGRDAVERYGEEGRDGVVVIVTRK